MKKVYDLERHIYQEHHWLKILSLCAAGFYFLIFIPDFIIMNKQPDCTLCSGFYTNFG